MATTDLKLQDSGSLPKPGTAGRLVRLLFGVLSLYYVFELWTIRQDLMTQTDTIQPLIWNGILPELFFVSYVVNIGFSRAWKKWPAIVSLALILAAGLFGYLQNGSIGTAILARTIWIGEIYVFAHLGFSFVLAAILATPGCEMRAAHHLFSKLTGKATKEHHCPVGPLKALDEWEREKAEN